MANAIEHVVVLMLENHSFDEMLGGLSVDNPEIDGVDPAHPKSNPDYPDPSINIGQAETHLTSIPHWCPANAEGGDCK